MKAARFHEHGGPEVLRYEEAPDPTIRPNEVLIRVRACAMNHLDLWLRKGYPGRQIPLPRIVGSDVSGEVVEAGELVTRVKPGDRVLVAPGLSCNLCPQCFQGRDSLCRQYTLFGVVRDGGYAELISVPEVNTIPIPGDLSFDEAAAVPLVFLTAWHMLVDRAQLRAGEEVLVLGAGSGVGSAAIQIAKLLGARVITTAGTDDKLAKARELGADEVINHSSQDIYEEVKRLTGKRGVDVVFEHVGQAVWEKCVMSLTPGGRLVTCGATTGGDGRVDLRYLFGRQLSLLGSFMGSKAELMEVLKFIFRRQLKPVIDTAFPLAEARAAHERMEHREQFGKILLHP
jgi:NADPH:quinone reductase-like Zn-dependent oxidoreductase